MEKPQPFQFEEKYYYNVIDLLKFNPKFFFKHRCKSTPKKIIEKMNINDSEYIFANYNKNQNKWYSDKTSKSHLLLSQSWVDEFFFDKDEKTNSSSMDEIVKKNYIFSHKIDCFSPLEKEESSSFKSSKKVFDAHASKFSCIYLFSFGKVEIIREIFKIPANIHDESIVCKYGATDDILQKMKEYEKFFEEKNEKVEISLAIFNYIDCKHINQANCELQDEMKMFQKFCSSKEKKLIILDGEKEIERMKKRFQKLGKEFTNELLDLQHKLKISEMEKKIMEEKIALKEENFKLKEENYKLQISLLKAAASPPSASNE